MANLGCAPQVCVDLVGVRLQRDGGVIQVLARHFHVRRENGQLEEALEGREKPKSGEKSFRSCKSGIRCTPETAKGGSSLKISIMQSSQKMPRNEKQPIGEKGRNMKDKSYLHETSPSLHCSWMYLEAVSGRLKAAKSRSEKASEITNMVVA